MVKFIKQRSELLLKYFMLSWLSPTNSNRSPFSQWSFSTFEVWYFILVYSRIRGQYCISPLAPFSYFSSHKCPTTVHTYTGSTESWDLAHKIMVVSSVIKPMHRHASHKSPGGKLFVVVEKPLHRVETVFSRKHADEFQKEMAKIMLWNIVGHNVMEYR